MSISLFIRHSDQEYAQALAHAVSKRWRSAQVRTGGSAAEVSCDFQIREEGYACELTQELELILSDDPGNRNPESGTIFRFTPVSDLVSFIKARLQAAEGVTSDIIEISGVEVWGITSGAGGSGTSSLAVALGRILARLDEHRPLLISFHRFSAEEAGERQGRADLFRRYLYRLTGTDRPCSGMLGRCTYLDHYGLAHFSYGKQENPLAHLTENEIVDLLQHVAGYGLYSHILLDIPAEVSHWRPLMRCCEHHIVNYGPCERRYAQSDRVRESLELLCLEDHTDAERRIVCFKPMFDEAGFSKEAWNGGPDIHGQYGAEVRGLADRLAQGQDA